jgi:hypothetical protein
MIGYAELDRALTERKAQTIEHESTEAMMESSGVEPMDALAFATTRVQHLRELVEDIQERTDLTEPEALEAAIRALWCDGLLVGLQAREPGE